MFALGTSKDHAKKLILDSPDYTRKAAIVLLLSLIVLFMHLVLGLLGTNTNWQCELDSTEFKYEAICNKLMKNASCRILTGPLKAEIILDIQTEAKASADITCPWENAMSELRICFDIGGILVLLIGLLSLIKESKNLAEMHITSGYFFSLLMCIAATFDFLAISDSKVNNFSLCNWTEEINLGSGVSKEHLECTYTVYEITAYFGYFSACAVLLSSYMVTVWKRHLVLD